MKPRSLIFLIVVIALFLGGYYLLSNESSEEGDNQEQTDEEKDVQDIDPPTVDPQSLSEVQIALSAQSPASCAPTTMVTRNVSEAGRPLYETLVYELMKKETTEEAAEGSLAVFARQNQDNSNLVKSVSLQSDALLVELDSAIKDELQEGGGGLSSCISESLEGVTKYTFSQIEEINYVVYMFDGSSKKFAEYANTADQACYSFPGAIEEYSVYKECGIGV